MLALAAAGSAGLVVGFCLGWICRPRGVTDAQAAMLASLAFAPRRDE